MIRNNWLRKFYKLNTKKKGFLLEDDIIDRCIEHDLDLVEIDNLCDKLLNQKMIVKDTEIKCNINDTESCVARSHLDNHEHTLEEVGNVFYVTRERVR